MIALKEIKKLIESNTMALATVDKYGNPHCIAVGDARVVGENILIGDNFMKRTLDNIKINNAISIAVWCKDGTGHEIIGKAEYFTDGKYQEMVKKIHKGFPAKGAILITIKEIRKLA